MEVFDTPELRRVVADMWETMRANDGAGLAAIQIRVPLRVGVFGIDRSRRDPDAPRVPETVLVNPEITPLAGEQEEGWEGCLSVSGRRGLVPRTTRIHYRGLDPNGNPIECEAKGFHARVVQHECDHLDGILYPQSMRDMQSFGFIEELEQSGAFGRRQRS